MTSELPILMYHVGQQLNRFDTKARLKPCNNIIVLILNSKMQNGLCHPGVVSFPSLPY